MRTLSSALKNHILSRLNASHSAHFIASTTGLHASTISILCFKECFDLQKSIGSHPSKLSPTNVCYAAYLITTRRAENAVQVTKTLKNVINQPLSQAQFAFI